MTRPLTKKQEKVWQYIKSCERSPTYREMMEALGERSVNGVFRTVMVLRERGFVTYRPGKVRSIVATDPNTLAAFTTSELQAELARRLAA